jgi:signal transduction histidine kinase
MDNKYERLAEDLSKVAAKLATSMYRLPFDIKITRNTSDTQVAYDCMALERISLRLIDQVFLGKRNDIRPWLEPQEDPCVRATQSLQGVFTNIARLDQVDSSWPDSDGLSENIATILRLAMRLLDDLAQMLEARRTQVTERVAEERKRPLSTIEDVSQTLASDRSLSVLASSAEDQAASLEAMLNFEYTAQAEIAPAADNEE